MALPAILSAFLFTTWPPPPVELLTSTALCGLFATLALLQKKRLT